MSGQVLIHSVYATLLIGIDEALDALGIEDGLRDAYRFLTTWARKNREEKGPNDIADGVEDAAAAIAAEYGMTDAAHTASEHVPGGLEFQPGVMLIEFDRIRHERRGKGHVRAVDICGEYLDTLDQPDQITAQAEYRSPHIDTSGEAPTRHAAASIDVPPQELATAAQYYAGAAMAGTLVVEEFNLTLDDLD